MFRVPCSLDLEEVACERKCLETTDRSPVAAMRSDGHANIRAAQRERRQAKRAKRADRMEVAVRADNTQGSGILVTIPRGRVVACRDASTGTRGRVGEVVPKLLAVTELMTKITKKIRPAIRSCHPERM